VISLSWDLISLLLNLILGGSTLWLILEMIFRKHDRELNSVKEKLVNVFSGIHKIGERSRDNSSVTKEDMESVTKILDDHLYLIQNGWYSYRDAWRHEYLALEKKPIVIVGEKPAHFITQEVKCFFDWIDTEYYYLIVKKHILTYQSELTILARSLWRKLGLGKKIVEIAPGKLVKLQTDLAEGIAILYADENVRVAEHFRIKIDSDAYVFVGEHYDKSSKKNNIVLRRV